MEILSVMTYRIVNRAVLAAFAVVAMAVAVKTATCDWNMCFLSATMGRACILCGCTRDVVCLLKGEPMVNNPWAGYILFGIALELVGRGLASFLTFPRSVWKFDALVHGVMLVIFMIVHAAIILTALEAMDSLPHPRPAQPPPSERGSAASDARTPRLRTEIHQGGGGDG